MPVPGSDNLKILKTFQKANFSGKWALALSTCFGIGLIPKAPGTMGTLATVPLIFWLDGFGMIIEVFSILALCAIGIWSSGLSGKLLGKADPPTVVIDEVAGFFVTMFLLPLQWFGIICGFVLFRFFDIVKPYPIRKAEKIGGGLGIVLDDLIAGIYAYGGTQIILFFFAQTRSL
jgi:phosphatidylglycerophosphatase A